jgi:hypothetical protein
VHGRTAAGAGPLVLEPDSNAPVAVTVTTAIPAKNEKKMCLNCEEENTYETG